MSRSPARSDALRLAHLHLRGGTYALARVELETLAGADRLDRPGILDLAEVRWRTGDLPGAAAAAAAWLQDGDEPGAASGLAHVISAEAEAAQGRVAESTAHVDAAAAELRDREALERLLAGLPALAAWPWEPDAAVAPEPATDAGDLAPEAGPPSGEAVTAGPPASAGASVAPSAGPGPGEPAAPEMHEAGPPEPATGPPPRGSGAGRGPVPPAAIPISRSASDLVGAGAGLLASAPDRAAVLLALALRSDRAAAEAVLAALDRAPTAGGSAGPASFAGEARSVEAGGPAAALAFVRAEALRLAGRHEESRIAYASAERLALAPAEAGPPGSPQ